MKQLLLGIACVLLASTAFAQHTDVVLANQFSFFSDADAEMTVANGLATVDIVTEGDNVQMHYNPVSLDANTIYNISFTAYSSNGNDMELMLHKHTTPWTNYGLLETIDLTTTPQVFTFQFTTIDSVIDDARLRVWFSPYDENSMQYYVGDMAIEYEQPPVIDIGEISLAWDPVTALCTGVPATVNYTLFYDTISIADFSPPQGYSFTADAGDQTAFTLAGLTDCVTYYISVAAQNGSVWSRDCDDPTAIGGYSTEIVGMPRPRLEAVDVDTLVVGESYTLVFQGANFEDGTFEAADITWDVPTVNNCNQMTVGLTVNEGAAEGARDVSFQRVSDSVVTLANTMTLSIIEDGGVPDFTPPGTPTDIRRTQP